MELEELVGEVLTHIDVDEEKDEILLTTESGRQIRLHHDQDCCEYVRIEGTDGQWRELIGKPILEAKHEEDDGQHGNIARPNDTRTRTVLTFKVDGATVISRWIGESNGCYSESVDIEEITWPVESA